MYVAQALRYDSVHAYAKKSTSMHRLPNSITGLNTWKVKGARIFTALDSFCTYAWLD
jgi:hypothetical protein